MANMSTAKQLTMGADAPSVTPEVEKSRIEVLQATIAKYLPDFVKAVKAKEGAMDGLVLHQDAFAAGYDDDEYTLLGMAIKYAGLHGLRVIIGGQNHETFEGSTAVGRDDGSRPTGNEYG
jgi:hypothetical protein